MNTVAKAPVDTRPKLLLVDDEPTNLQVLRSILQADYRLLYARDGAKALELAAAELPELVLLDVMMPGMSGHEVCATLKAPGATTAHIPVVALTAHDGSGELQRATTAGCDWFVPKPCPPDALITEVRRVLAARG